MLTRTLSSGPGLCPASVGNKTCLSIKYGKASSNKPVDCLKREIQKRSSSCAEVKSQQKDYISALPFCSFTKLPTNVKQNEYGTKKIIYISVLFVNQFPSPNRFVRFCFVFQFIFTISFEFLKISVLYLKSIPNDSFSVKLYVYNNCRRFMTSIYNKRSFI